MKVLFDNFDVIAVLVLAVILGVGQPAESIRAMHADFQAPVCETVSARLQAAVADMFRCATGVRAELRP